LQEAVTEFRNVSAGDEAIVGSLFSLIEENLLEAFFISWIDIVESFSPNGIP
jgi:hypothetical protein